MQGSYQISLGVDSREQLRLVPNLVPDVLHDRVGSPAIDSLTSLGARCGRAQYAFDVLVGKCDEGVCTAHGAKVVHRVLDVEVGNLGSLASAQIVDGHQVFYPQALFFLLTWLSYHLECPVFLLCVCVRAHAVPTCVQGGPAFRCVRRSMALASSAVSSVNEARPWRTTSECLFSDRASSWAPPGGIRTHVHTPSVFVVLFCFKRRRRRRRRTSPFPHPPLLQRRVGRDLSHEPFPLHARSGAAFLTRYHASVHSIRSAPRRRWRQGSK